MTRRKRTPRILLAAGLIALLLPQLLLTQAPQTVNKETYNLIQDQLICQCGCNYLLRHCPHLQCPSAPVMRAAIRDKLAAGLAEPEVIKAMVADFGPAALAAPPTEGFDLTAWVMPFVALLLGLWFAVVMIRRWRRQTTEPAADPDTVDRYRNQVEQEMRHLEE
jgi:cytochrome c-type biogenesis protein CcmH